MSVTVLSIWVQLQTRCMYKGPSEKLKMTKTYIDLLCCLDSISVTAEVPLLVWNKSSNSTQQFIQLPGRGAWQDKQNNFSS